MFENKDAPIRFTPHALDSARKRGASQLEVQITIKGAPWRSAKHGRIEAEMEFNYNDEWNGIYYQFKKINPVFVLEEGELIVITVYCFYY